MSGERDRILLLGYGNPGRFDDGLGPALADAMAARNIDNVTVESDYQLHVEDAVRIAEHDIVVFADAAVSGPEPYALRRVAPGGEVSFSTHSVSPGALLALARDHFQADTAGWLLAVRGYTFDGFGEGLSASATKNLDAAVTFLAECLTQGDFREVEPNGERLQKGRTPS